MTRDKRTGVLIIVENLPLPFDRRVWQEARTLRDAGYHVSVLCPKQGEFRAGYETLEGIEIYRYPLREGSGPLSYVFEYLWAFVAQLAFALRIYWRARFRVIQACNPPDTIFLVALFFKPFGVRFVFDHHDLNPELYLVKFKRRDLLYRIVCLAERLTYRSADVAIATNASYAQVAMERGHMPPDRVFIVHSTPELKDFQSVPSRAELKQGRRLLVLYLGTMGLQDGVDILIEAASLILGQRSDVSFQVVGGGPEVPRLKKMATEKGLDGVLSFAGVRVGKDLAGYLSTADVGVAPDPKNPMNDKSTMNKIMEYMAFGKPVVLFDLTEGRRVAGDAALYAQPDDPRDFAARIIELLDSESLRRELGERGRRRIEESLNWDHDKVQLLAAYRAVLSERPASTQRHQDTKH
jgi:glycosyltransferase involved in cell wall biosynthesis